MRTAGLRGHVPPSWRLGGTDQVTRSSAAPADHIKAHADRVDGYGGDRRHVHGGSGTTDPCGESVIRRSVCAPDLFPRRFVGAKQSAVATPDFRSAHGRRGRPIDVVALRRARAGAVGNVANGRVGGFGDERHRHHSSRGRGRAVIAAALCQSLVDGPSLPAHSAALTDFRVAGQTTTGAPRRAPVVCNTVRTA